MDRIPRSLSTSPYVRSNLHHPLSSFVLNLNLKYKKRAYTAAQSLTPLVFRFCPLSIPSCDDKLKHKTKQHTTKQ